MLIIGERINSSRKSIAQAISSGDAAFIQNEAMNQIKAGADYLDVNVVSFGREEAKWLRWIIEVIQEITNVPLCIDSPDPKVIETGLSLVKTVPMINSIILKPSRLEPVLALAAACKCKVIALCESQDTIAKTCDAKVRMAGQLVEKVTSLGVPIEDLYIDPLLFPVSTDTQSAVATLNSIEQIMKQFPGVHTICGLTNVSYGLPNRQLVNRTFLVACITKGLDSVIIDPTDKQLYASVRAALMLMDKDEFCMEYITAFREGRLK